MEVVFVKPARAPTRKKPAAQPERAAAHQEFWKKFVAQSAVPDAAEKYFNTRRVGDTKAAGDEAAQLVLSGAKTAASSLRMVYEIAGEPLPEKGSLSIFEDGSGRPVAVIETTDVVIDKFFEIDDAFVRAYGEWGGSLKSWRRQCRAHYSPICRSLGRPFSEETEMVLERFRVVFKMAAASGAPKKGR
jgi:uncharacterized protein YhfF